MLTKSDYLKYSAAAVEYFEKAGIAPQIRVECDYMLRTRMVEEQFGVALSSGRSCRQISSRRVCFVPVTDPVYLRTQALFWHPARKKTAAAELEHYLGLCLGGNRLTVE